MWRNILLLVGATVGAGVFSLPHVLASVGILPFVVLICVFAYITFRINYFYTEVIKKISGKHQLSGYVRKVFGTEWERIALTLHILSTLGSLIGFTLIGATFLSASVGLPEDYGLYAFCILTTATILLAGKKIAAIDTIFAFIKIILFGLVIVLCISQLGNVTWKAPLIRSIPLYDFGIFLFAFTGFSIIPELLHEKNYLKTLGFAQVAIALLYLIFPVSLVLFLAGNTFKFDNPFLNILFNASGFVSVFTAYLMQALVGKDMLENDLHVPDKAATLIIAGVAFLAVVFQIGSFVDVLSFTGGVFLGGAGLFVLGMYSHLYPTKHKLETGILQLVLVAGMFLEILTYFIL